MSESPAQKDSSRMLGAAALLRISRMTYADEKEELRFYVSTRLGKKKTFCLPKDQFSDAFRFAEALQERVPLKDGRPMAFVLDVPLSTEKLSPTEFLIFLDGWRNRTMGETTKLWGRSFLIIGPQYMRGSSVQKIPMEGEHYYNVVLLRHEKDAFAEANPGLSYVKCSKNCHPRCKGDGRVHYHGVHGYYKGSNVSGIDCAPPFRLSKSWNAYHLSRKGLGREISLAVDTAAELQDDLIELFDEEAGRPRGGAEVLAGLCCQPFGCDDWRKIRKIYQDPDTAFWASGRAYFTGSRARRLLRSKRNKKYAKYVKPLLRGEGTPVLIVLQYIWGFDRTSSKTEASYLMRKLCSADLEIETLEDMRE